MRASEGWAMAVLVTSAALGGCASAPAGHGSFLEQTEASVSYSQSAAGDVAKRMGRVWPPARTELAVTHPANDAFGTSLIDALRHAGYAVHEFDPHTRLAEQEEGAASGALPLSYVVDALDPSLIRVSITVGGETLSRAYVVDGGSLSPGGAWTRRGA